MLAGVGIPGSVAGESDVELVDEEECNAELAVEEGDVDSYDNKDEEDFDGIRLCHNIIPAPPHNRRKHHTPVCFL